MPNVPQFKFSIRFMLTLVMLTAILLASRNTLLCHYHQWALEHATSESDRWYVSSFEAHIKELARLGRYEKRRFVLSSLPVDTIEAQRLFIELRSVRGSDAWLTMGPYGGDSKNPEADNITVICAPEKMYLYQHLIEKADAAFAHNQK